jgi:hypothetical protein
VIPAFERFVAIDWSGAKGARHKGIAVAMAKAGRAAPMLVRPAHVWSRTEVLEWLLEAAGEAPTLFGFDFSFAPPIAGRGEYLPGEAGIPADARGFWAYVDHLSDDQDLGAASFLERAHRRHFYFGAADGAKRDFLHHRICEQSFNQAGGGKASTVYDAIGAAQVAKASFAGMRMLHGLQGRVPVWPIDCSTLLRTGFVQDGPFDPSTRLRAGFAQDRPMDGIPGQGSVVVEIYTRAFIRLAGLSGRKVRSLDQLDAALKALGSEPSGLDEVPSDHGTDVLISAAGLRAIAGLPAYWNPPLLTPALARTEGWTFGVP